MVSYQRCRPTLRGRQGRELKARIVETKGLRSFPLDGPFEGEKNTGTCKEGGIKMKRIQKMCGVLEGEGGSMLVVRRKEGRMVSSSVS